MTNPATAHDSDPTFHPALPPAPDFHIPDLPFALNEIDPDRPVIRTVPHAELLKSDGDLVMCAACAAQRDWLLLNVGDQVFIRCRCAHEWPESRLTRADFDELFSHVERVYPDFETAMRGMAFDGLLRGVYIN
ncbi:hypothetical protein [Streptacidiphilus sp. MAP5-3]|uniref:hypothetical protein n=1 Tax=unclassified Streptacidiphilus TaxID=2643834 RepID=UPI003513FD3C